MILICARCLVNLPDTLHALSLSHETEVLELHNNDLSGTISKNICDRRDTSLAWSQLTDLTADCDEITCTCCTCYRDGKLLKGTGN